MVEVKRLYLMPDEHHFLSLFSAFQHMVKGDYMLSQIKVVRSCLKFEGLEFDSSLPNGWQVKEMVDNTTGEALVPNKDMGRVSNDDKIS